MDYYDYYEYYDFYISPALLLAALFIYLKLTNRVNWSWLWVTSPLWIPIGIIVAICLIAILVILVVATKKGLLY